MLPRLNLSDPEWERSSAPAQTSMSTRPLAGLEPNCWHEIEVKPVVDPVTKERALLLVQRDVSERARLERNLAELTEAQLSMLSQIFPRHVIEALSMGAEIDVDTIASLARSHHDVSILFMDIAGFTAMSKDVPAEEVIIFLNILFSRFDILVESHGVQKESTCNANVSLFEWHEPACRLAYKIWPAASTSTILWYLNLCCAQIGDAYLVASGILVQDHQGFKSVNEDPDPEANARRLVAFAFDMMQSALAVYLGSENQEWLVTTGRCTLGCTAAHAAPASGPWVASLAAACSPAQGIPCPRLAELQVRPPAQLQMHARHTVDAEHTVTKLESASNFSRQLMAFAAQLHGSFTA
ncbi:guanylate cyclase domain-containing protein [Haematococcus lacustris]|uniref:Guanylate cyclase domain-containing protein n=1 Tax=Haematococcus lacustris TaxID=44745 RepID=A0A699ZXP5_HAELA|nr:guanylate cyclase domain-containing protein [Haematococcus lacustris]